MKPVCLHGCLVPASARLHPQRIFRTVIAGFQLSGGIADHATSTSRPCFLPQLNLSRLHPACLPKPVVQHEDPPARCHSHPQRYPHHQPCHRHNHVEPATIGVAQLADAAQPRPSVVKATNCLSLLSSGKLRDCSCLIRRHRRLQPGVVKPLRILSGSCSSWSGHPTAEGQGIDSSFSTPAGRARIFYG